MVEFVEDFWSAYALQKPDLVCLRQDAALYRTMLVQPHGEIAYDKSGIWIQDRKAAEAKFDNSFHLCSQSGIDLFVAPEYSCPWTSLVSQIKNNNLPAAGSLWVVGCQSIHPAGFNDVVSQNENVSWVYDKALVDKNLKSEKFLDPVCLVLKTKHSDGSDCHVAIVQFKTSFFGGKGFEWERDNMLPGTKFYVLSNHTASSRLLVLICSDTLNPALNVEAAHAQFVNLPFLVVHIQLNQEPNGVNYKTYRNVIFSRAYEDKEVICLNWARNIVADGKPWNLYGNSGLYSKDTKAQKFDLSDTTINTNHQLGLYYTYWFDRKAHVYLLNFDENIFVFDNTKASQLNANASQQQRSGPKMVAAYQYVNGKWDKKHTISDGLASTCEPIEKSGGSLACLTANPHYLNAERLVQLSCGDIVFDAEWFQVKKLNSIALDDHETNKRVLFTHEPLSQIISDRERKLMRYTVLKHRILKGTLPPKFKNMELKLDSSLTLEDKFLLNVHSTADATRGTAIYIGDSLKYKAQDLHNKVSSLFRDSHFGKNVMIFYQDGSGMKMEYSGDVTPKVPENIAKSQVSIKRTGRL